MAASIGVNGSLLVMIRSICKHKVCLVVSELVRRVVAMRSEPIQGSIPCSHKFVTVDLEQPRTAK